MGKITKRIPALLLAAVMIVSLAACSKLSPKGNNGNGDDISSTGAADAGNAGGTVTDGTGGSDSGSADPGAAGTVQDNGAPDGGSDNRTSDPGADGTEPADGADITPDSDLPEEPAEPEIVLSFSDNGDLLVCAKGQKFWDWFENARGFSIAFYEKEEDLKWEIKKAEIHISGAGFNQKVSVGACTYRREDDGNHNVNVYTDRVDIPTAYEEVNVSRDSFTMRIPDADFAETVRSIKYVRGEKHRSAGWDEPEYVALAETADCIRTYGSETAFGLIPEEFITSEYDREYFNPETDMFRIIEVYIPNVQFCGAGFARDSHGFWIYGYDGITGSDFRRDVKLIYMITYDDFGPVKGRLKVVYEDERALDLSFYNYPWIKMTDATGVNSPDEDYIESIWGKISAYNEKVFPTLPIFRHSAEEAGLVYHGKKGSTRYFSYDFVPSRIKNGGFLLEMAVSYYGFEIGDINNIDYALKFKKGVTVDNGAAKTGYDIRTWSSFERSFDNPLVPANNTEGVLDLMLNREHDEEYFRPVTDNYVYVIDMIDIGYEGSGDAEEDYLYSFDENGQLVQYVKRKINNYYLNEDFHKEDYPDEFRDGAVIFGDTEYDDMLVSYPDTYHSPKGILTYKGELVSGMERWPEDNFLYYDSQPGKGCSNTIVNIFSPDDFDIDDLIGPYSDDYAMKKQDRTNSSSGLLCVEELISFDQNGNPVHRSMLKEYKDEASAQAAYDSLIDSGDKSEMSVEGSRILIRTLADSRGDQNPILEAKTKFYYTDPEYSYLSVPYYTEKQFLTYIEAYR